MTDNKDNFIRIVGISLAVQLIAIFTAMIGAGGGHGTYAPARLLFPYSMLSTIFDNEISLPFVLSGLIQYPLYGFVLAAASRTKPIKTTLKILVILHAIVAIVCFVFPNKNFPNIP